MTKLLVVLQNAYDKGSLADRWNYAAWKREFESSRTGTRLLYALPDMGTSPSWRVHYANAAPGVGRGSRSCLRPSRVHLRRAVKRVEPDVVLACGRLAEETALAAWEGSLLAIPHPAYMCLTNELLDRCRDVLTAWGDGNPARFAGVLHTPFSRLALRQRQGHVELLKLSGNKEETMSKQTNVVVVQTGEYVTIPGTNKHVLAGPGRLEVTRKSDGTVYGRIVEGQSCDMQLAVKRRYTRVSWGV
jgi:hypothetical protein